jgi:hypothetical protein
VALKADRIHPPEPPIFLKTTADVIDHILRGLLFLASRSVSMTEQRITPSSRKLW